MTRLRWGSAHATITDVRRLSWLLVLCGAGCATSGVGLGTGTTRPRIAGGSPDVTLPEPAATAYTTDPGTNGIVGPGAVELANAIAAALHERGDTAQPDQTLAALAVWYHAEVTAGRDPSSPQSVRAAGRLGFVGALQAAAVVPMQGPEADAWRQALTAVVRNIPITRFGVWVAPDGGSAVVAFAAVELTLAPFPRIVDPGATLGLRGEIAPRYVRGDVFLTGPDGHVREIKVRTRRIDVSLTLATRGMYRVEVMGDGPSGPVVLANVPVYVGVPEPRGNLPVVGGSGNVADSAARMLDLLNRARAEAAVAAVQPDPELRAVALGHSQEMAAGHFFGHVSPTTGTVGDRVKRAGILVSVLGENVSQGESAESAHQGLMGSPGHRAAMLDPRFTHVGIGIATSSEGPPLVATLVFGRRPDVARLTAPQVMATIATLRRQKGVPPVAADSVLQTSADAGIKAFVAGGGGDGGAASRDQAMDAANAALVREDLRMRIARGEGCAQWMEILDLDDLQQSALLVNPGTKKVAAAVALHSNGKPPLSVLIMIEGTGCK